MKKYLLLITVLFFSTAVLAEVPSAALPVEIRQTLDKAFATGDKTIATATKEYLKITHPSLEDEIEYYHARWQFNQKQPEKKEAKKSENKKQWEGSIELGVGYSTGNTEEEQLDLKSEVTYKHNGIENTLKAEAHNNKENDSRTDERYEVQNQMRYNLTEHSYAFGEVGYTNDRFSGFEYRLTELLGYGYHFIKGEKMTLTGEQGFGARQSSLTSGSKENSTISKTTGKFDWAITESLNFKEELSYSIGGDTSITKSETALKSKLIDTLYLKLSFNVEHISDVPLGKENTDTETVLTLGYDF